MTGPHRDLPEYYGREGDGFMPSMLSASPWRNDAQNGVALGLLMAQTLEAEFDTGREQLARFTLDILHPAPFGPTTIAWRSIHDDSRLRILEGVLEARGVEAARAGALVLQTREGAPSTDDGPGDGPGIIPPVEATERVLNQVSGLSVRLLRRANRDPSVPIRKTVWVRVDANVVPGTPASRVAAAIAAADMGALALSRYRDLWEFPNLDVAVHFIRPPRRGWLRVDTEPLMLGAGVCVIDHRISDGDGVCARAHQTLFFSRRRSASP